jgi:GTP cyclohydrolase II
LSASAAAAAIAALRGGRPVAVGALTVLAVETASGAMLALVDPNASAPLLISGERAAALKLGNVRDAADPEQPVVLARSPWLDPAAVRALIDPKEDFSRGPVGPLTPVLVGEPEAGAAALVLTRLAGLMPALWLIDSADEVISVTPDEVTAAAARSVAVIAARARLPIAGHEDAQAVVFRAPEDGSEHLAILIGAPGGAPPLVRLHSECLTGDVFGSLKCDCGPQLAEAMRLIGEGGGGILLYLREEGRGIGLANKLRAYQLQDRGLDTVEANRRLGFADDLRQQRLPAAMLRALGVDAVRLLTNNPRKVAGLEAAGIRVVERVPHHLAPNPHNAGYLAAKRAKSGHLD